MSYSGPGTICGGLPIWATVAWGYDPYTGESDAEITELRWLKRDGTPGSPVSQKVWDKAEAADPYFCDLTEALGYQAAEEDWRAKEIKAGRDPDRALNMIPFDMDVPF